MKKQRPASWLRPSYSYEYSRGIRHRRRILPALLYLLAISIPMSSAIFLANVQVKAHQPQQKAHIAAAPKFTLAIPAEQPKLTPDRSIEYENEQLQNIVAQFVNRHTDHKWSVQLQGLGSDERSVSYDSTDTFRSASMFKILLMYSLIQKLPMSEWSSVDLNVGGKTQTVGDCVDKMLRASNNPCGKAVGDYIGWQFADDQLRTIGLEGTRLDDDSGPKTTAKDVAYFLHGLYEGKWFDGETRSYIIKTLDQQIFRAGIPAGCGSGCAVADKTGDLGFVRHDAGVVRYAGGAYVLSIFTDGASYFQIAQLAGQLQAFMSAN